MLGEGIILTSVHKATTRMRAPFGTISASPSRPTVKPEHGERKLSAKSRRGNNYEEVRSRDANGFTRSRTESALCIYVCGEEVYTYQACHGRRAALIKVYLPCLLYAFPQSRIPAPIAALLVPLSPLPAFAAPSRIFLSAYFWTFERLYSAPAMALRLRAPIYKDGGQAVACP